MGRRYDTAFYAGVVARVRAAFPQAAVHADLIVGFPTEDQAAWERSISFVRSLDLAGIHVFRYSERPGTPATRMTGQVPEPARRARAAEALAIAAAARRRFAAGTVGHERQVLFEQPHPAGGWVGHAENHVLVRSGPGADSRPLAGELARVAVVGLDPGDPERVLGRVLAIVPGPRQGMPRAGGDVPSYPSLPEPVRRQLAPRPAEVPHEL
jgi:tRNA A37 methylthiotransferase MiaB